MYTLELNLKQSPLPLSVQKKTLEAAQADYDRAIAALKGEGEALLEFTCEQVPEKRISCLSSEVAAVQLYEKSASSASGKPPGFFGLAANS